MSFYKLTTVSDYLVLPKDSQRQMCPVLAESLVAAYNYCFILFFQVCKRAEFSKSCNLIGSMSRRLFAILPAINPSGIVA